MSATGIGAAVRRKEDQRFITGRGHYTDDVNRPGQVFAVFVRSPHAHARIKRIDASRAKALPGVRAKGITSRMFEIPVINISMRSKPRPKPECGTVP